MNQKFFYGFMILFMACQNNQINDESHSKETNIIELSNEEIQNNNIKTDTLKKSDVAYIIHAKGIIDVPPQNIYSLSIPLGGYLKYTHLLPGTPIKKGEIIAVMEDPQYIQLQEDYLNTKAQLSSIEKNYLRQKQLAEQNAVSQKYYEQAYAEYEISKIKLKALEEKLQLININPSTLNPSNISRTINIYAPFNGYITKINASIGKYIPPAEVLFELVNPNDIHLNIKVFEKDLEHLNIGQNVLAYTNSQPQNIHHCKIILINKMINNDRSVDVHCHFDKYDEKLIPGTFMQADILTNEKSTYVLPSNAIVFFNNKHYAFIQLNKNKYQMQEVLISNASNNKYISIQNYQELLNKKIVVENAYALLMKLKNNAEE